ncbi:imidazolonepropionase [Candidatus Xianfuyuplasma coldseepsis]|uniref:Imidazolonepropionase n=1 Tax=Candidatus Xianfuyuplasma coldseepsis TaxID=2782163 RepID=A0A7L7KR94_9MOLU|nr:imidazolonepropionase [Xianfuyuplasma coldseepsis]QMS84802.1 imidazolonepropionase [Xianfuyuplasma coldseepsis]
MRADTIIYNIKELYTPHRSLLHRGTEMAQLEVVPNAFIAIKDGKIIDYGQGNYSKYIQDNTYFHNAENNIVIPGLIDSHTHLVHAGSREKEFRKKLQGVSYLEILNKGGGILSTVKATRNATHQELYDKAYQSLNEMLLFGVTTIEAKSGYGLNTETELKILEVMKDLQENHPVAISTTYLGAHAIPHEFRDDHTGYVDQIIHDLPIVKSRDLAESVDVFCESGAFTNEETKRILEEAKRLGFHLRVHADEIEPHGGTGLAVDIEASSADHLMAASDEDIKKLAKSKTVANLLPATSFYLDKDYAKARHMIDSGCIVSISSDYNPGSSPSENYQLTMQIAANKLRMTPYEILVAATINPAYSLGLKEKIGSIARGKQADLVIMNAPNLDYIMYHFGVNHTKDVFKNGRLVVKDREIV